MRTFLLVGVLATFLKVVAGVTTTTVPFTSNYLASTDATHTRVLNGGQHVDLALDQLSGNASKHLQLGFPGSDFFVLSTADEH